MAVTLVAWPLTKTTRVVDAVVLGQRALQLAMHSALACHDAAGGGRYAVAVDRRLGGLDDFADVRSGRDNRSRRS